MTQARPLNETERWLMNLEMERTDRSYLNPRPPEARVVYITRKVYPTSRDDRDKLMFNAGRYAAGARDKTAIQAHKKLEKESAE
jgi:hypothetical protein